MATEYLSQADIGDELGVGGHLVNVWRSRSNDFPEPDIKVGRKNPVPGWLPARLPEIRAWVESRPGRGAGGGRPRKNTGS